MSPLINLFSASNGSGLPWLPLAAAVTKASLLLLAAAGASRLLRRASAAARHFIWTTALLGALVIPALSIALPRWEVPVVRIAASPLVERVEPGPAAVSTVRLPQPPAHRAAPSIGFSSALAPVSKADDATAFPLVSRLQTLSWPGFCLLLWIIGLAVIIGRLGLGLLVVQWMSRRTERVTDAPWLPLARQLATDLGISSRLVFLRSARATMPMAWGVFRPAVLMPADADEWPVERLRIVLLHELAHVKRRDCLTHMLAQLACAAYWFNPLAWMAAGRARAERERACDDLVLAAGTRGSDYAEELLEMARVMRSGRFPAVLAGATLAMAHRSQLEGRLIAILDPKIPRAGMTRLRALAASGAFSFAVLPIAALQPWTYSAPVLPAIEPAAPSQGQSPELPVAAAEQAPRDVRVERHVQTHVESHGDVRSHIDRAVGEGVGVGVGLGVAQGVAEGVMQGVSHGVIATVEGRLAGMVAGLDTQAKPEPAPQPKPEPAVAGKPGSRRPADPRTVAALTAALKDTDKEVRETAMHALAQMRDPAVFEPLVQALRDESPDVREQAAFGLGQLRDRRAVEPLVAAIKDAAANVREQAVFALGQLRDAAAIEGLTLALRDSASDVREQAAFALGQIRDPRAVSPLGAALKDSDADVREQAAFALGQIRDRSAVETLIFALKDIDPDVREQAAFALGQLRDPRAIDALTEALKDVKASVRQQAAFALGQISR